MNKRKPKTRLLQADDKVFEKELLFVLRSTGKLFPRTPKEVEAFRQLGLNEPVPDDCLDPLGGLLEKQTE